LKGLAMVEELEEVEQRALLVNDIKVLVSQLNECMERAAERGLDLEVEAQRGLRMKAGKALGVTVLSVRVLAEVR
jgi:hypothetical protein